MKAINKLVLAAAVMGGVTLTTTVARAQTPTASAATSAAAANTYKDDGAPWYYLDAITSTCEPMPAYGATPDQYKTWIEANKGQITDFKVMMNDKRGNWVSFTVVSEKGVQIPVHMIQPEKFCQEVLDVQAENGMFAEAPKAAGATATAPEAAK